jgi:hypothetical protein
VFFVDDIVQADWKVVLLHAPRSRRVLDEVDDFSMGAAGRPVPLHRRCPRAPGVDDIGVENGILWGQQPTEAEVQGVEVPGAQVHAVDAGVVAYDSDEDVDDGNPDDETSPESEADEEY